MPRPLDHAVGRRVDDNELITLRRRLLPQRPWIDRRVRQEARSRKPLAQIGVLVKDAVREAQRAPRAQLSVAVELPALRSLTRAVVGGPDVRTLVREEDRLAAAPEPGELIDHVPKPPDAEDRLAEVEMKDVVRL